jgi:hypothetical protein
MLELLVGWVVLLVALIAFAIGRPGEGGAITLAYFLGLSLIHVPGVLPFVMSQLELPGAEATQLGFELTLIGMAGFVAGAVLARRLGRRHQLSVRRAILTQPKALGRIGWRALAIGIVAYFVFIPVSVRVPSLTSVVSAVATILILGLWLVLYAAVTGDQRRIIAIIVLLPLLPLATLVSGGFLGFGVYWVLSVLAFLFVITRHRMVFYLSTPLVIYLGLSLFVTYMGQRTGIRDVVWREQAMLTDRLDRVSTLVTQFQLLDLNSRAHVLALDDRLNQNELVGIAITRHASGWSELAYGGTVPVWAFIPRAVWPDKPVVGGGASVVSDFTGAQFAEGTSVGAGQVLEFYVNFGVPGVMIGFLVLGFVLKRLDQGIMRSLAAADTRTLLLRAMPGLVLLQPGGNLLEIIVAAAAALIAAQAILWLKLLEIPAVPPNNKSLTPSLSGSEARARE